MPFNPCGHVIDMTARAHNEPCRFFTGSDREDVVAFYEAPDGAPTFPGWSVVYPAQNDPVKWPDNRIGCIDRRPFTTTLSTAPPGLVVDHYCGTLEEFANGASAPASPPRPVGAWGLPLCCDPPRRVRGGAGGGGRAVFAVVPGYVRPGGGGAGGLAFFRANQYEDATEGGGEGGGSSGDVLTYTDAASGGGEGGGSAGDTLAFTDSTRGGGEGGGAAGDALVFIDSADGGGAGGGTAGDDFAWIDPTAGGGQGGGSAGDVLAFVDPTAGGGQGGGSAGDVFDPGTVTPGTTCATAGVCALETTYGATSLSGFSPQWWRISGLTNGTTYYFSRSPNGMNDPQHSMYQGGACPTPSPLAPFFDHTGCYHFVADASGNWWVTFSSGFGGPTAYTWKLSTTAC